jgi:MFS family permease
LGGEAMDAAHALRARHQADGAHGVQVDDLGDSSDSSSGSRMKETDALVASSPAGMPAGLAKLAAMSVISGANSGYSIGIVSFVLVRVRSQLSGVEQGAIGAAVYGGLLVGCPLGALLARRWGRRVATLIGELLIISACLFGGLVAPLCWASTTLFVMSLLAWRVTVGMGVGICITVKPLYIAELAPDNHRGKLLALMGVANAVSIMGAHSIDFVADGGADTASGWWCAEILFGILSPILLLVLLLYMPESPAFLAARAAVPEEQPEQAAAEEARHTAARRRAVGLCASI